MSVIIKKYKDVKPNEKHKHGRREKEGGGGGGQADFSWFIEQDKKEVALSEFVVLEVNGAATITNKRFVSFCF